MKSGVKTAFRIPAALALATSVGLIVGLLGAGLWDVACWALLGCPVILVLFKVWGKLPRNPDS